jgi:hypothetical protein
LLRRRAQEKYSHWLHDRGDKYLDARRYVAGLTKKLNQWTDEQKLLHDGRRWFKPNDPAMISDVVIGERAIYLH